MSELISINEIIDIIKEKLSADGTVVLKVTGNSMYPFLRNRVDSVVLKKTMDKCKVGDIVLFNYHGNWILHRIIKIKGDMIIICGDALRKCEYAHINDIIGVVDKIIKKDTEININRLWYRIKVKVWMILKPFRKYLIWFLRKIKKGQGN